MGKQYMCPCIVAILIAAIGVFSAKLQSRNKERRQVQIQPENVANNLRRDRNAIEVVNKGTSQTELRRLKRYLPRERDLRPRKLFRLLGKKRFNTNWMSINKPLPDKLVERNKPGEEENVILNMLKSINNANDLKTAFRSWLLQQTSCYVKFRWKDLGPLVWPRYVKNGSCESKQSCSFPAGMKCVPGDFRKFHILKWRCVNVRKITIRENTVCVTEKRVSKFKRPKLNCKWKRARFRVLQNCVCTC